MENWKLKKYDDIASTKSICNKEILLKSKKCGCYYCSTIFTPDKIEDWIEENSGLETALCPFCGIDAIIPESNDYELCKELLDYMYKIHF